MKVGMLSIWDKWAERHAVTVVQLDNCQVVQVKTNETNGYTALQLGVGEAKLKRVTKPLMGHYEKNNLVPNRKLWEFRVTPDAILPPGTKILANHFVAGQVRIYLFYLHSPDALFASFPAGRCVRHQQGKRLPGSHEALGFQRWSCIPRKLDLTSCSWFYRLQTRPWPCLQEQENAWANGSRARHRPERPRAEGKRPAEFSFPSKLTSSLLDRSIRSASCCISRALCRGCRAAGCE